MGNKKQKRNHQREKMLYNKGSIVRFYLKPAQISFLNKKSLECDESPSAILRKVIDIHEELCFFFKKNEQQKNEKEK